MSIWQCELETKKNSVLFLFFSSKETTSRKPLESTGKYFHRGTNFIRYLWKNLREVWKWGRFEVLLETQRAETCSLSRSEPHAGRALQHGKTLGDSPFDFFLCCNSGLHAALAWERKQVCYMYLPLNRSFRSAFHFQMFRCTRTAHRAVEFISLFSIYVEKNVCSVSSRSGNIAGNVISVELWASSNQLFIPSKFSSVVKNNGVFTILIMRYSSTSSTKVGKIIVFSENRIRLRKKCLSS